MSAPVEKNDQAVANEALPSSVIGMRAVITGGSSGIGRMLAEGLSAAGAEVVVASRRVEDDPPPGCEVVAADVAKETGCQLLADAVAQRWSAVDVLVNNAGTAWVAPIEEYPDAAWDKVLSLNVKAVFNLTKALLPLLLEAARTRERGAARVINIGSADGLHVPALESYAYTTSKAGVHHLTRHLARDLAPDVTVNALAPGPFPSRMLNPLLEERGEELLASVPLGRYGQADDILGPVGWLTSRGGAYVTGAVIPVDGGMSTTV